MVEEHGYTQTHLHAPRVVHRSSQDGQLGDIKYDDGPRVHVAIVPRIYNGLHFLSKNITPIVADVRCAPRT